MDSRLTYLVGGRKNGAPIPDGIDLFGYLVNLFISGLSHPDVPEIVVGIILGLLDCL